MKIKPRIVNTWNCIKHDVAVNFHQKNFRGFNVSEIVEGGSLGHGTGIRGKFDIDLVIYSRGRLQ